MRPARQRLTAGIAAAVTVSSLAIVPVAAGGTEAPTRRALDQQWEGYFASSVTSPVELAPMRQVQETRTADGTTYRLTALHPRMNSWFLVERVPPEGSWSRAESWHLENTDPERWRVSLEAGDVPALIVTGDGDQALCTPWDDSAGRSEFETAARTGLPYAPVCGQRLYLRNAVSGNKTNREAVSDFLRDNVIFGDSLVNLIKGSFYEDAFLESAFTQEDASAGDVVESLGKARLDRRPVMRTSMGLPLVGAEAGMEAGSWYEVADAEGVYASALKPGFIEQSLLGDRAVNWLDGVESGADVYLVAFDLGRFEMGYELGTDHPTLGWSSRPQRSGEDWRLAGPDGFDRSAPLVRTGMLNPSLTSRVAAAFAGGFKRDHGAFRFGDYATFNRGHHYGMLSNGVTFSRLQPNLATLTVTLDGTIEMRTWTEEDNAIIPDLAFARQNGVPLVERDAETGAVIPGDRVTSWGGGNWSGSAEAQLRTLRAGACLRQAGGRQFLIYGYFSAATPSAMARVFQAYECDYAMLLDMNSPELTYLAVYRPRQAGDGIEPMHLSSYMAAADPSGRGGERIPRFVGFADNRDFFYLLRKE